jgi:hypothetical protein
MSKQCECGCGTILKNDKSHFVSGHYSKTEAGKKNSSIQGKKNRFRKVLIGNAKKLTDKDMYWFRRSLDTSIRHQ